MLTEERWSYCFQLLEKYFYDKLHPAVRGIASDDSLKSFVHDYCHQIEKAMAGHKLVSHSYCLSDQFLIFAFVATISKKTYSKKLISKVRIYVHNLFSIEFGNGVDIWIEYVEEIDGIKRMCCGKYIKKCKVQYETIGSFYQSGQKTRRICVLSKQKTNTGYSLHIGPRK